MSFLLTFLASISTLFGSLLIFIKKKTDNIIICSLAFAAGVMITVSITDLIPESYNFLTSIYNNFYSILLILIFINIGIIIIFEHHHKGGHSVHDRTLFPDMLQQPL